MIQMLVTDEVCAAREPPVEVRAELRRGAGRHPRRGQPRGAAGGDDILDARHGHADIMNPGIIRPMHIAHVSPEMTPLAKAGGLGDVAGSLPPAQAAHGHEVTLVLPAYGFVLDRLGLRPAPRRHVAVALPWGGVAGAVIETSHRGVRLLLLVHDAFNDRAGIYGGTKGSYGDNGMRFGWFAAAALEALRGLPHPPAAVIAHAWPTGLVPVLLASGAPDDALARAASAIVIHNLAHQGIFPLDFVRSFGVAPRWAGADGIEALGFANYLKGAIYTTDVVVTVSPTYARFR